MGMKKRGEEFGRYQIPEDTCYNFAIFELCASLNPREVDEVLLELYNCLHCVFFVPYFHRISGLRLC